MASRLRALRVLHPFPSVLNAALVVALTLVAGGAVAVATILALAMLALQFCIGLVNDIHDTSFDAATKPWKPIPAGLISPTVARRAAVATGVFALAAAATQGVVAMALAATMLACGLVYDLWLKPTAWAWACFSVAFAILPVYAWFGATGTLPPLPQLLIPLGALAGPALQLSNGLVDLEADRDSGVRTLATRLGRNTTLRAIAVLLAVIHVLAWTTLSASTGRLDPLVVAATGIALVGFALQLRSATRSRELGWSCQAVAIALLAFGWLAAVAWPPGRLSVL